MGKDIITKEDVDGAEVILAADSDGEVGRWLKACMFLDSSPLFDVVVGRDVVYSGFDAGEAVAHYNEGR